MMPPDVEQDTDSQSSANQSIIIDTGKHAASTAICAAFAGICAAVTVFTVMRFNEIERHYSDEAEKTGTEYRLILNHYMELEASVKEMRNGK